ncbi:unnamed protein product [Thelazia callipaeda]|uniref:PIR Superfamily Protein n=1 Tax=Thelazia callipaeda TaxID=103827 RepID=A0A0N5CWS4_THECL|nr:unnamed protein product [Thelazia callipaeda]
MKLTNVVWFRVIVLEVISKELVFSKQRCRNTVRCNTYWSSVGYEKSVKNSGIKEDDMYKYFSVCLQMLQNYPKWNEEKGKINKELNISNVEPKYYPVKRTLSLLAFLQLIHLFQNTILLHRNFYDFHDNEGRLWLLLKTLIVDSCLRFDSVTHINIKQFSALWLYQFSYNLITPDLVFLKHNCQAKYLCIFGNDSEK